MKHDDETAAFAYATAINTVLVMAAVVCVLTAHPVFAVVFLLCGPSVESIRAGNDDERRA